jgi:hypothetical protein
LSNHLLLVYADLPSIYEMQEAKALPEMNRGEKFDELKTFSAIAMVMRAKLMLMAFAVS